MAQTKAQTMSKDKAVQGIQESTKELMEAEVRRKEARTALTAAENAVEAARGKKTDYEAHLERAIQKELGA